MRGWKQCLKCGYIGGAQHVIMPERSHQVSVYTSIRCPNCGNEYGYQVHDHTHHIPLYRAGQWYEDDAFIIVPVPASPSSLDL